jgi:L-aminopeptidase/D-esterase-like protein
MAFWYAQNDEKHPDSGVRQPLALRRRTEPVVITSVPGVRVGHWTDPVARTGCSVVLLPAGTTASGEIRGGAPGTREWGLLSPERTVERVDAVVLTGGSAFGLAACDGVVRWCEERGIGYPTAAGPVPIVIGLVLYDLGVGDPSVRPGAGDGYTACLAAADSPAAVGTGAIGAGAGATLGKWQGPDAARPGGLGSAVARHGELIVAALLAVNAMGDVRAATLAAPRVMGAAPIGPGPELQATTIGAIVTNAGLDKVGCLRVAQSGHDGLARALDPVHTAADGDALVAAATAQVEAPLETVRALAAWVVERAVHDAAGAGAGVGVG